MRHPKLIYSQFVSNRPERTTLFELWCMLGGAVVFFYVVSKTGVRSAGLPELEVMLSLLFPAIFFCLHYLIKEAPWINKLLKCVVVSCFLFSIYLIFCPYVERSPRSDSDLALCVFCAISLLLTQRKWLDY